MPDDGNTTVEATTETAAETTETSQPTEATSAETTGQRDTTLLEKPVSIINEDGTFVENWQNHKWVPEELRNEECLKVVKDFGGAISQLVHGQKAIGKNKIAIPTDKSKPDEWEAYWDAGGRPKTADDYEAEIPDELQGLFPKDRLQASKELAHKLGISKRQFAEYMKFEVGQAASIIAEQDKADAAARQDAEAKLRQEFGRAFDDRMTLAQRVVNEALPDEGTRLEFLEEFGNNPRFIRFASEIGLRLKEDRAQIATLTQQTPKEAISRIKELQATPGYMDLDGKLTADERAAITAEIRQLTKEAYPEEAAPHRRVTLGANG